jgi:hypothetical protein
LEKRSSSWNREPALGTGNQFLKLEPVLVTENNSPDFETGQNRKPVLVTVNLSEDRNFGKVGRKFRRR